MKLSIGLFLGLGMCQIIKVPNAYQTLINTGIQTSTAAPSTQPTQTQNNSGPSVVSTAPPNTVTSSESAPTTSVSVEITSSTSTSTTSTTTNADTRSQQTPPPSIPDNSNGNTGNTNTGNQNTGNGIPSPVKMKCRRVTRLRSLRGQAPGRLHSLSLSSGRFQEQIPASINRRVGFSNSPLPFDINESIPRRISGSNQVIPNEEEFINESLRQITNGRSDQILGQQINLGSNQRVDQSSPQGRIQAIEQNGQTLITTQGNQNVQVTTADGQNVRISVQ
jgi:hypothetical protein